MIFTEIAQANAMVAQAEHLLWTARRPTAKVSTPPQNNVHLPMSSGYSIFVTEQVAILYPRSSALCLLRSTRL